MTEPISSASNAAEVQDDETTANLPKNAEDRKAAAALNALNAQEMTQDSAQTANKQPSAADQEALGKAMSRLEIASGINRKTDGAGKKSDSKKEVEVKKKIKVSSEDVNFLVEELDLSKNKATELIRAHDGDVVQAIKAFIQPRTIANGSRQEVKV